MEVITTIRMNGKETQIGTLESKTPGVDEFGADED